MNMCLKSFIIGVLATIMLMGVGFYARGFTMDTYNLQGLDNAKERMKELPKDAKG